MEIHTEFEKGEQISRSNEYNYLSVITNEDGKDKRERYYTNMWKDCH